MSENLYESSNMEICPYCQKAIEDKFFDDHMMCHELENEEQSNNNNNANNDNNINQQNNNNINNNINNNQNNNQNNTNNRNYTGGLVYNLINLFTGSNNNNQNNSNSSSTLANLFSTLSNTFSNINQLSQQLNNMSVQYNTNSSSTSRSSSSSRSSNNINNFFAPPPIVYPNNSNNNNNPNNNNINDFPSNIANILLPNLIIGERGHVFNPLDPNNNNNINIDAVMGLLPSSEIKEKKEGENNNCIICLADFEIGDKVTSLPCLHMFHTDCIKNWLKSKNHCPICKYTITEESLRRGN